MLEKFTLGQLASIFNINIQTLYYYDKIGLLIPEFRAIGSGNRTYSFKQVQQLSTILYLKKCGFSLDEIKDTLSNLTPSSTKEKLVEKSDEIIKQWKAIIKLDEAIHKKLDYIDLELSLMDEEKDNIVYRKKRYYLTNGVEEDAYGTELQYYYPSVVCYFKDVKVFGSFVEKNNDENFTKDKLTTIPNGKYLIIYHKGPYSTIYKHLDEVYKAYPDLNFTKDVYTFDIVDRMNCSKIEDYITKLEFQLEK